MKSTEIQAFRDKLHHDQENENYRRVFHENYEWIEAFCTEKYSNNKNAIIKFSVDYNIFYWNIDDIKGVARQLCIFPPVGNSSNDFIPSPKVCQATYFLRHKCNLFEKPFPELDEELEFARKWGKGGGFQALIIVLKQIRDNLFHGKKIETGEPQYSRNRDLVRLGAMATTLILDNLEEAETEV